jgi:hypothetical protein
VDVPLAAVLYRIIGVTVPERSNDFQRLVFQLQKQLVQDGFSVTESKMVAGRTGRKREVDIAIEGKVGGHAVFFAVECRDHERRPDVKWIEELVGKYQHVPADKVIAVSRSGFSADAIDLARTNVAPRIETLSLTDALDTDWHAYFSQLRFVTTDFLIPLDQEQVPNVTVILPANTDPNLLEGVDLNGFRVLQPGRGQGPTLPELLNTASRNDNVIRLIHQNVRPDTIATVPLEIPFPDGTLLVGDGRSVPVSGLAFTLRFRRERRDIPLEHGSYAGAHVAYATADNYLGGKAHITMLQSERNISQFAISFDENVSPDSLLELELQGDDLESLQITTEQLP